MATKKVLNNTVKKQYIALGEDDYDRVGPYDTLQECVDYIREDHEEDPSNWEYYEVVPLEVEIKVIVVDKTIVEVR